MSINKKRITSQIRNAKRNVQYKTRENTLYERKMKALTDIEV